MTSLKALMGKQVVSRASAETLGTLEGAVVDVHRQSVAAWQIGKGRHARIVDHAHVTGIGEAAAIVDEDTSLRDPATDEEKASVKGPLALIGARVLTDAGEDAGQVDDAEVDTASGALVSVSTSQESFDGSRLRGLGSFALVVTAGP